VQRALERGDAPGHRAVHVAQGAGDDAAGERAGVEVVLGGANFSNGNPSNYGDGNGHGTHVSGTIAAMDNDFGVVGVAPGAGIYAVRVLDNRGSGWTSGIIAGVDWVTAHKSEISVANMSLGGSRSSVTKHCTNGVDPGDAYHTAICGSVAAGITYVVAAGNENKDACTTVPAGYGEVITVSALADFDGAPGGAGSGTWTSCNETQDDSFACFSNYGSCVDVMAPGVGIDSTWNDGGYKAISGTSMASPHVAGAAVRYLKDHSGATPASVLEALVAGGEQAPCATGTCADDPDGVQERLVLVGTPPAPPPPPECTTAGDCTGGDLCTVATCTAGACSYPAKSCADSDACTADSCDPVDGAHF
jgi:subtilisin family serine protease